MPFICPFTERDGRKYEAGSREAFRRHLTIHHGRDYRRMENGCDDIVTLEGRELSDRLAAVRRSQRHRKPKPYLPPPPPESDGRALPPTSATVRSMCVVPPAAEVSLPSTGNFGPPPVETAFSLISWCSNDLEDSRPDSPIDFDIEPETFNPYAFLDSLELVDLGQPPVDSTVAEATSGHGQLPVDPVVAPPALDPVADAGLRRFLQSRGLAPPDVADAAVVVERFRDVEVQTVDPRIISPSEFITYRQSFDTLTAANHMALLVRGCSSMDATALADQTAIRLGLPASDRPSWDALYRMAVTSIVVERHLQARLGELLAASTVDPSGGLAIASVLVEMQARQRRPWDLGELPQPGDSPELFAIMPPATD